MEQELSLQAMQKEWHGSLKSYLFGFFTSLFLTTLSFLFVSLHLFTGNSLIYTLVALAVIQAFCQFFFFLHIGEEAKPRWMLWVFFGMLLILFIISAGSLWIMNDLNDRMMPDMTKEMHS